MKKRYRLFGGRNSYLANNAINFFITRCDPYKYTQYNTLYKIYYKLYTILKTKIMLKRYTRFGTKKRLYKPYFCKGIKEAKEYIESL